MQLLSHTERVLVEKFAGLSPCAFPQGGASKAELRDRMYRAVLELQESDPTAPFASNAQLALLGQLYEATLPEGASESLQRVAVEQMLPFLYL